MSTVSIQPFSCTFTPAVHELLWSLKCSLAVTTYQAGKLIFISADEKGNVRQLSRDFKRAMGLAVSKDRLAIATENEVLVLSNAPGLSEAYPNKPAFYDHFYTPRACYYTGAIDLHDMAWDHNGNLWAVNTLFSSLVTINDRYSFEPQWMPPFITRLSSGDCCHLNGMAMVNERPKFVSMFGNTHTTKGWRAQVQTGGLIMDIESNETVAAALPMPHSPRWINGELYCLLSATGQLVKINIHNGSYDVVTQHNGFVRGLAQYGDYLFVGLSKNRQQTSVPRNLPVAEKMMDCGVDIVHLPSATIAGSIKYLNSAEEIYDVQVLPFTSRPGILNHTTETHRNALHTPTDCFWAKL